MTSVGLSPLKKTPKEKRSSRIGFHSASARGRKRPTQCNKSERLSGLVLTLKTASCDVYNSLGYIGEEDEEEKKKEKTGRILQTFASVPGSSFHPI